MRFPFLELPGAQTMLTRPVVPVQFEDLVEAPQLCLIDSGATRSRLPLWLAQVTGISLAGAPQAQVVLAGLTVTAYAARCDLTVASVRLDLPVSFCDPWPFAFGLLGQEDFLRAFRLTLCVAEDWLELDDERTLES